MPPPSNADKRFLEFHGNSWRVTVNVPKRLQDELGTKLKRSLGTDSLREANLVKWDVVSELKGQIEDAKLPAGSRKSLINEAKTYAELLASSKGDFEKEQNILSEIADKAEALSGYPIGTGQDGNPIYDPESEEKAHAFLDVARRERTPIDLHHEKYLGSLTVKPQTKADDERAMQHLMQWCKQNDVPAFLNQLGRTQAVRFFDDMESVTGPLAPRTLNKYLRRLGAYWSWLFNRGEVQSNVWDKLNKQIPKETADNTERPFTKEEMVRLLSGDASPQLHDLMCIAALTGCRLDPIVCLKVKDCLDGKFIFKPQKKETASRVCPIHPDLVEIVERRSIGKEPDDDLFPEWPVPNRGNKPRSNKASNQFTAYRRTVGVTDVVDGKRRSLTNFHSFRRWFITEAERADQPPHIISAIVGHKREGTTLSIYSSGPNLEQARRCVEAVKLPHLE